MTDIYVAYIYANMPSVVQFAYTFEEYIQYI